MKDDPNSILSIYKQWVELTGYTPDDTRFISKPYDPCTYTAPAVFPKEVVGPYGNMKFI